MSDLRQQLTRSLAETGAHIRAVPLRTVNYEAFQVAQGHQGGRETPLGGRTYTHGPLEAATLQDAITEALTRKLFSHKDHLLIRETGDRGVRIHVYAIKKQSAPTYVYEGHVQKRVQRLYAAPLCTIDGGVLL